MDNDTDFWLSKKGDRVDMSSLAAESHVVQATVSILTYLDDLNYEVTGLRLPEVQPSYR